MCLFKIFDKNITFIKLTVFDDFCTKLYFFIQEKNKVPETRGKFFFDNITSKMLMNKKIVPVGATTSENFF